MDGSETGGNGKQWARCQNRKGFLSKFCFMLKKMSKQKKFFNFKVVFVFYDRNVSKHCILDHPRLEILSSNSRFLLRLTLICLFPRSICDNSACGRNPLYKAEDQAHCGWTGHRRLLRSLTLSLQSTNIFNELKIRFLCCIDMFSSLQLLFYALVPSENVD